MTTTHPRNTTYIIPHLLRYFTQGKIVTDLGYTIRDYTNPGWRFVRSETWFGFELVLPNGKITVMYCTDLEMYVIEAVCGRTLVETTLQNTPFQELYKQSTIKGLYDKLLGTVGTDNPQEPTIGERIYENQRRLESQKDYLAKELEARLSRANAPEPIPEIHWVPCSKKMPPPNTHVLTVHYSDFKGEPLGYIVQNVVNPDGKSFLTKWTNGAEAEYWSPMPKLPVRPE